MTNVTNSESTRRWELVILLILFGIVAVSRFKFWEISFWDWDEILFAKALHRFNVWEHRPAPPGYPGYVVLTRGLNYLLHDDVKSLVFTNVFFGSLMVFPLYFLYCYFSSRRVALWATALSLFNPIIWYFSETAFNDVTSLFWTIASLALLYRYENNRLFYLGMLSMGIAMSIRPQNVLFGILLVPLFLWRKMRRGKVKPAGIGLALLVAMCFVWFIPLIRSAGGLASYMSLLELYGKEIATGDQGYLVLSSQMSLYSFTITKLKLMWGNSLLVLCMVGLTLLGIAVYFWRGRGKEFLLLMLGFVPSILVDFLWLALLVPKYNMPTIVLSSFFVAYGLFELLSRYAVWGRVLASITVLGFTVFSAYWALPSVRDLHTAKSPLAQFEDYVHEHLNPKTDAVLCDQLPMPHYLSEYVNIYREELEDDAMAILENMNWYYFGPPNIPGTVLVAEFRAADPDRMRQYGGNFFEVGLSKTDVLYSKDYAWCEAQNGSRYHKLVNPEARCYLKNNGHSKILSLESAVSPSGQHGLSVTLELDENTLVATEVLPNNRLDTFFVLNKPRATNKGYSTLIIRTEPPAPNDRLMVQAVNWWDIDPAPVPQVQEIDFNEQDTSIMRTGWSAQESQGESTFTWSDGAASVLSVPLQPRGIYALTFQAIPVVNADEPDTPQAVTVCMDDVCSPELELVSPEWQTYTRVLRAPAASDNGIMDLTFRYRFTYSPDVNGTRDERALGVAFKYMKLSWLGSQPMETVGAKTKGSTQMTTPGTRHN